MLQWVLAGLGLLLALAAFLRVRRVSRRLDALNQSYWELRYDYTRLRARLARLDPADADGGTAEPPGPPGGPEVTFVPLSTIRKKDS